jgi:hypothetical protein
MKIFFLKRVSSPLSNEHGVAALMSIILAIIILGSIAFNYVAETRQKQSGSILTYTSTNAMMIAEAGLRYTQKCLQVEDATFGCPAALQGITDWTTITNGDNFNKDFGGAGNFAINFATPTVGTNDSDNIFIISTGTFKGGQRSLSRFISRACILGESAVTSCLGTTTKNNSFIDPPLPNPPVTGVCPPEPPGMVDFPNLSGDCDSNCAGLDPVNNCPNFNINLHITGGFLDPAFTQFCNFKLDGSDNVKTKEANHLTIKVIQDFEIKDNATLRLNDDAVDPTDGTKDTTITVYDDVKLENNGEIRVKGTLTLNVADKVDMKNSSRINNNSGEAANASIWAENDVTMKNSALFIGSVTSDGTIALKNNAEVQGALSASSVSLKNNATVIYNENEDAGSATTGYSQCASTDVGPNWSE